MAEFNGRVDMLGPDGQALDAATAEFWSAAGGGDTIWGGDLTPVDKSTFAAGLTLQPGARLKFRLPNGRIGVGEVERIREGEPHLVRVEGVGAPPFVE